jgi:organic radical activating enzyme
MVIGVFFDNICNLKCVTCGPVNSTQWIKDYKTYKPKQDTVYWGKLQTYAPAKLEFVKAILANATFSKLRFELFGGEPLIGNTSLEFLDWLYEQPYADRTTISLSTNGTTYLSKFEKYIDKFHLNIMFSMDGIGPEFEYLRTNAVFEETQTVIDNYRNNLLLKYPDRVRLSFNYTLSWMNSLHFADFYNWATTRYPEMFIGMSALIGPFGFSINALTPTTRQAICKLALSRIKTQADSVDVYKLSMIARVQWQGTHVLRTGLRDLEKLDGIRNRNYKETFREVLALVDSTTPPAPGIR